MLQPRVQTVGYSPNPTVDDLLIVLNALGGLFEYPDPDCSVCTAPEPVYTYDYRNLMTSFVDGTGRRTDYLYDVSASTQNRPRMST